MSFIGYPRTNGQVGARNLIGIVSTVSCANDVALWISQNIEGCVPFLHGQGCCQTQPDLDIATRTLISIGCNPNLAGVLLVSLGCESLSVDKILEGISASQKPVDKIIIQKDGGAISALAKGCKLAGEMVLDASKIMKQSFSDDNLVIGVK